MTEATTNMLSVLKLFLIPVGGGIPAGVMLAQTKGVAWPVTALLYLVSDIILALLFEPVLRLLAYICSKISFLGRVAAAMKAATARSVHHMSGTGAGPIGLIMIAFGVDPMTGRATAHAAGHGFLAGWTIAIAGDMLYFAVIAISTLKLNTVIEDPNITMLIILVVMFSVPTIIKLVRSKFPRHTM
ncbi:hypothetical protein KI809_16335 [Geobacter pelophilus]|uniref:Uncharacterized protein n=1 Tax=Geoanaerobacter pelophilus TaxID=60036 RepID=A0AAW4L528_9BACT|nr:hypothetical protein [Geoanaerobacter pelophilus]MBT0665879.1 hypothetical protein [Geoanaerobacter pelophilus]